MKKIANILFIILILVLLFITKNGNMLPLTISFGMYMLLGSMFSTTGIKMVIENYYNKKYYYSVDKIFNYTLIFVFLIGILFSVISYFVGNVLAVDNMGIINIFMSLSLLSNVILRIVNEYVDTLGYKNISNSLIDVYNIIVLSICIILSLLLFNVFKLAEYINIILLYLVSVVVFIVIMILLYLLIFNKRNKAIKKREENKLNYISKMKEIIVNNKMETVNNIVNSSYIYVSIIILYYVLMNRYNYDYLLVSSLITNTYFYGFIIIYMICKVITYKLNINYQNIKDTFNNDINKIIKISLNLCILLMIIFIPLNNILFTTDYNILSGLVPFLFFYILYNYIININIRYSKNRNTLIVLLVGLVIKIIFEIPFINALYRMGYSLTLGSIAASIFGLIISMIVGMVIIEVKFKINLLNNFNNILNIVYESIIYSLVLVLFTLIVKVDRVGIVSNVLVIIFYIFITILFHIIKRILAKK